MGEPIKEDVAKRLRSILDDLKVDYFKVILFGSRAGGEFNEESDWDFLIVTNRMEPEERRELRHRIYRRFHEYFPLASVDIILKDADTFEQEKEIVNTISNEVYLEGAEI